MNRGIIALSRIRTAPVVTLFTISLLLGSTAAIAANVIKDGDTATGIQDLTIGGNTYDVAFTCDTSTADTYPPPPPLDFDFDTQESAGAATDAIITALNADGGVLAVGCGSRQGEFSPYAFRLAYRLEELDELPAPGFGKLDAKVLLVTQGARPSDDFPTLWARWDSDIQDQIFVYGDRTVAPLFTETSSGGPGNSPPVADVGGPYFGSVGSNIRFDGTGSDDLDGNIVSYLWQFGDGESGIGASPAHTYATADTYNVTLTVMDNAGTSASDGTTATIATGGAGDEPPVADAGGDYTGSVGVPVVFDGSGSTDDDKIVSYTWDFGDDSLSGSGVSPSHVYSTSGQRTIQLTVEDSDGNTAPDWALVQIGTGAIPPTADAGGPYVGQPGGTVRFDGTGSSDPDGKIIDYFWNFGDGSTGTGATPTHTYSEPRSYAVTLTVTDDDDILNSAGTTAVIVDDLPVVGFSDVEAVEDINGNGSPDFVVLKFDVVNAVYAAFVMDGLTGAKIRRVGFDVETPIAMEIVTQSNGAPAVAVLRELDDGQSNVLVKDLATGAKVGNLFYGTEFDGIDLADAGDIDNSGAPDIAVLGVDGSNKVRIQLRNLTDNAFIDNIFQGTDAEPLQLEVLPDVNGVDGPEIAVLSVRFAEGRARVWVQEIITKATVRKLTYGSTYVPGVMAYAPDAAGVGQDGIALIGTRSDTGRNRLQVLALSDGAVISNVFYDNNNVPVDIETVADTGTDGAADLAVLFEIPDGTGRVSLSESATGVFLRNVPLPAINSPVALTISEDINGNGKPEVAGLGNADVTTKRIDVRDANSKASVTQIDVP